MEFFKLNDSRKGKLKIIIAFAVLFLVVSLLIVMIFYAGKKTYTVRFDLNGGTLISGSLEQQVTQGQSAAPPTVVKDGAYLHSWSASTDHVTKDMVVSAVWNYETTKGIIYSSGSNQNFAEISGAYKYINGEVYLGSYYGDRKILGIKDGAFADCEGITKIYLLDGLLAIGDEAFWNCTALTEIEIPKTVTHLGSGVFRGCESLETVVLNEGLLEIGDGAFENCESLKEIVIPSTVREIGAEAFRGCESLEKVIFVGEIEEIADSTFEGCVALREIVLPENLEKIGSWAFSDCTALTSVTLSAGLREIGTGAFEGCEALKAIEIPYGVTVIGELAFAECEDIVITVNVKTRGEMPEGWVDGWQGDGEILWVEINPSDIPEKEEDETSDDENETVTEDQGSEADESEKATESDTSDATEG